MASANKIIMKRSQFFQPYLLKVSFFFSLLVVLFLLISFVFLTPENIGLANLVQKINAFLSWPYTVMESVLHVSMHWVVTALCILLFWFLAVYLILLFLELLKQE
jgi:hypothetical protein